MIEVSIARDKTFNALSEFAQLLYLKILPHTDDFGRMEGDPETVKVMVDGFSKRKAKDYAGALAEVANSGLWIWYETDGGRKVVQFKEQTFERINAFLIKKRGNPEYPPYKDSYKLISGDMAAYHIKSNKQKAESKEQEAESKKTDDPIVSFAENVKMTNTEFQALIARVKTEKRARRCIDILDNYKGSKWKTYKSDYRAILSWVVDKLVDLESKSGKSSLPDPSPKMRRCDKCGKEYPSSDILHAACYPPSATKPPSEVVKMIGELEKKMDNF